MSAKVINIKQAEIRRLLRYAQTVKNQMNMKTTNEKPKCEDAQCPLVKDATLQACPKCGAERPTL